MQGASIKSTERTRLLSRGSIIKKPHSVCQPSTIESYTYVLNCKQYGSSVSTTSVISLGAATRPWDTKYLAVSGSLCTRRTSMAI